jgi:hypothetical protein
MLSLSNWLRNMAFVLIRPKTDLGESATSQSTIRLAFCGASVRASRVLNKPLKPIAPKTALRFSAALSDEKTIVAGRAYTSAVR